MLEGEIPMWEKVPIIKGLAETERFELSVQMYPYDGLANPGVTISNRLNSCKFLCFHAVKPHAERATDATNHIACRHKSRHTSQGGKNDLQNRRLRAERARSAKRATSESAVTERPLGGVQPSATVHGIAGQLQPQNILSRNRGQGLNGREGSDEHHPCA